MTPSVLAIYVVYLLLPCECDDYLFKGNDIILVNCTHVTVCLNFYKNKNLPFPSSSSANTLVHTDVCVIIFYIYASFCSLFVWSNETLNIWSHLLGFILFLMLMLYDNLIAIPRLKGELSDHVVTTIGLICYQVRLPCSG